MANLVRKSSCGVVANMLDSGIVVSKCELHLRYKVDFRIDTLGKGMNILT